jgi:hypothetical protein
LNIEEEVKIKILGHSGCSVEIVENFGDVCVRKATQDKTYMSRLRAQVEKQRNFSKTHHSVKVPEIYSEYCSERVFFTEMEYIPALDIFSFVSKAGKGDLDKLFHSIERYLLESLSLSHLTKFPTSDAINKIEQLENTLKINSKVKPYLARTKEILLQARFSSIPIGECHGDLTFSNILIEPGCDNIYLIDFLDSFIETPIQDIVKLKQDMVYYWSTKKTALNFDVCRAKIAFSYLNKKLDHFIDTQNIDNTALHLFQTINLMRILPYTEDATLSDYLLACIKNELTCLETYL